MRVSIGASPAPPRVATTGASPCRDRLAPRATARVLRRRVSGTARDRGCSGVARVEVSVARQVGGRCRFLDRRGHLGRPRACARRSYLVARGTQRWTLPVRLPRGRLRVVVRVHDLVGNMLRAFSRPRA